MSKDDEFARNRILMPGRSNGWICGTGWNMPKRNSFDNLGWHEPATESNAR